MYSEEDKPSSCSDLSFVYELNNQVEKTILN